MNLPRLCIIDAHTPQRIRLALKLIGIGHPLTLYATEMTPDIRRLINRVASVQVRFTRSDVINLPKGPIDGFVAYSAVMNPPVAA